MIHTVEVKPTPLQLAESFWDMDADEQAMFFNYLGACALAKRNSYHDFDMQMCFVSSSPDLIPHGARIMEMIGAFVDGKRLQPLL